jgi:hypothetical protein
LEATATIRGHEREGEASGRRTWLLSAAGSRSASAGELADLERVLAELDQHAVRVRTALARAIDGGGVK